MGMAALPSGALVLARGVGVHNESLADKFLTISAVEKHHSILGNYILLWRPLEPDDDDDHLSVACNPFSLETATPEVRTRTGSATL